MIDKMGEYSRFWGKRNKIDKNPFPYEAYISLREQTDI